MLTQSSLSPREWKDRFDISTNDVTFLYTTNKAVHANNHERINKLGKPIALIEAKHTGKAKSFPSDKMMGLQTAMFLSVDSKVVMTCNICQPAGLCNGAVGVVKDIVYKPGTTAPALPWFVWVDFGASYTGTKFYPPEETDRQGWVPVHPFTATEFTSAPGEGGYQIHTRTMLPLKLAWAWTIWKAQGQTIRGKLITDLGDNEKEHGLTYTAFSRVTNFSNFGIINGITLERFTTKIKGQKKVKPRRQEEQRLRRLAAATMDRLQRPLIAAASIARHHQEDDEEDEVVDLRSDDSSTEDI